MPVVSMINRKTGVGKTTLTLALADYLSAIHGRNVLIIDMDPQATASILLLGEAEWKKLDDNKGTVADVFERALQPPGTMDAFVTILNIRAAYFRVRGGSGQVSVMVGSPRLQEIEDGALDTLARRSPYAGSLYTLLPQWFAGALSAYDYVLIDCPPSLGIITLNALTISSGYLIPTRADYLSMVDLVKMTQRVRQHSEGLRREIRLHGTVVTRFMGTSLADQLRQIELRYLAEVQPLWNTTIPEAEHAEGVLNQCDGTMTLKARYGSKSNALYSSFESLANEFLLRIS